MKLILEFDVDADIIEVPQYIVDNRDVIRRRFLKWIYNKHVNQKYQVIITDTTGKKITGVRYRGDAFVEWLNKKELRNSNEKAVLIEQYICEYPTTLPTIAF